MNTPAHLAPLIRLDPLPSDSGAAVDAPRTGSRRRRIWEFSSHAQCPVIGVCLPIEAVRRLVDKVLGGQTQASDYELHCGVNTECRQRNPLSEAVQRELDQRYALGLQQARALKSTSALAHWWQERRQAGVDLPASLWATLTHPRCDTALEEAVLQDVHMLQHQRGAAQRADLGQLQQLLDENQVLTRSLAAAQRRCTQQSEAHARQLQDLQAQLMQSRAALIRRDTAWAALQDELHRLEREAPELRARSELHQRLGEQIERSQDLERALMRTRHALERERLRAEQAEAELRQRRGLPAQPGSGEAEELPGVTPELQATLAQRAVLCVGGRTAAVPAYRALLEQAGARFLHHDGGEGENITRLEPTLAAADLVICQTGCISHDAYWRVKEHCKRHGKPCVFVDTPSTSSLRRALDGLKR